MKKRLRKKCRIGEFTEFGFSLRFMMSRELDEDGRLELFEAFLAEVDRLGLQIGGGGLFVWSGFVEFNGRGTATEQHRSAVLDWLEQHPYIENPHANELVDAWHGQNHETDDMQKNADDIEKLPCRSSNA